MHPESVRRHTGRKRTLSTGRRRTLRQGVGDDTRLGYRTPVGCGHNRWSVVGSLESSRSVIVSGPARPSKGPSQGCGGRGERKGATGKGERGSGVWPVPGRGGRVDEVITNELPKEAYPKKLNSLI